MNTIKPEEAAVLDTPHKVDVRKLLDTDDAQVMLISLDPGEALKPHVTPVNVFFYILEGWGTVTIGEETKEVDADTLVESPANILHTLENTGRGSFRFLVAKTPKPATASKIL
jgi:quercetin dioxygenase-like cupin family protein